MHNIICHTEKTSLSETIQKYLKAPKIIQSTLTEQAGKTKNDSKKVGPLFVKWGRFLLIVASFKGALTISS